MHIKDLTIGQVATPATVATPPPSWVFCICGCGGLVRDGGPEEEAAWARVFAEAGIEDPAPQDERTKAL